MNEIVNRCCGVRTALAKLCMVAALACAPASNGFAGVQDSVFTISPDGGNVALELRDVSRGEVFKRLLASRQIELEWADPSIADETISGSFKGSSDAVLQRLLKPLDFVIVYGQSADKSRMSRLIILGKAGSRSSGSPVTAQIERAPDPLLGMTPPFAPLPGVEPPTPVPPAADKSVFPISAPAPGAALLPAPPDPGRSFPISAPAPGVVPPMPGPPLRN